MVLNQAHLRHRVWNPYKVVYKTVISVHGFMWVPALAISVNPYLKLFMSSQSTVGCFGSYCLPTIDFHDSVAFPDGNFLTGSEKSINRLCDLTLTTAWYWFHSCSNFVKSRTSSHFTIFSRGFIYILFTFHPTNLCDIIVILAGVIDQHEACCTVCGQDVFVN